MLGFPYLKIKKLSNSHFMFFDRYEIHIPAFLDFIKPIFIIFRSSASQNYFKNRYSFFVKNEILIVSKQKTWYPWHTFLQNISIFLSLIFTNIIFPGCSHILSNIFEVFWYNKMSKYGAPRVRISTNHEHVKFLCLK